MFKHKAVLINVNRTVTEIQSVYAAVRCAWVIDPQRAAEGRHLLALQQGLIVGVFTAERWMKATSRISPAWLLMFQGDGGSWAMKRRRKSTTSTCATACLIRCVDVVRQIRCGT